jgi:hypothetical protein
VKYLRAILLLGTILMVAADSIHAQQRTTSVGLCYRPIFPLAFLGTGEEQQSVDNINFTLGLKSGFSGGMVIRRGFTELLSGEIGINYVKRNYDYSITDSGKVFNDGFTLIGYEVPISLLAFIQLGEAVFMNASMGVGLDAFASSVRTYNDNYEQFAIKKHSVEPSLNANIGWEYRTYKSGAIYLGATYHRPFSEVFTNSTIYRKGTVETGSFTQLSGSYLTADLRYYFHAEKDAKKKRKSRD